LRIRLEHQNPLLSCGPEKLKEIVKDRNKWRRLVERKLETGNEQILTLKFRRGRQWQTTPRN
jgi:hypothetical protein